MSNKAYTAGKNLLDFQEDLNLGFDSIDAAYGDGDWFWIGEDSGANGDSNLINVTDLKENISEIQNSFEKFRENISEIRNSFENFQRDISGIGNQGFNLDELLTNVKEIANDLPIFDLSEPIVEQSPLESPEMTETQGSSIGNNTSISDPINLLALEMEFNETVGFTDLLTDISSAPIGLG